MQLRDPHSRRADATTPRRSRRGWCDFVEACYAPAHDDGEWVRGLASATRFAIGSDWAQAFSFRVECGEIELQELSDPWFLSWLGSRRVPTALLPAYSEFDVARLAELVTPSEMGAALRGPPLPTYLSSSLDTLVAIQGRASATAGVMTFWSAGRPLSAPERGRLRKLAAHLRAGARLRAHRPDIQAVLDPAGRVHHAEAVAKDRRALQVLSAGAKAIERARAARTLETLETWHALWDGRWTLVDSFDKDGKRWLVAKENSASSSSTNDALQPRERDVALGAAAGRSLKLMAYELGLPLGTVASTLSRVMRKLRVRSRAELAMLLAPLLREDLGSVGLHRTTTQK